jgi:hypothetical protein
MTSKPLIISHRGNLYGPQINENRSPTIHRALELGFEVQIDLWVIEVEDKKTIWMGFREYQAEDEVHSDFLQTYRDRLWIHAKNEHALNQALSFDLHCFFYFENSPYTLTSEGWIWYDLHAKPMQEKTSSKHVILSLPESEIILPEHGQGWCTDYPILLQYVNKMNSYLLRNKCWRSGLVLDATYSNMERNTFTYWTHDSFPDPDERRCVAIFGDFIPSLKMNAIFQCAHEYMGDHLCFGFSPTYRARLHFTIMQISSFSYVSTHPEALSDEYLQEFSHVWQDIETYASLCGTKQEVKSILFHRVLVVSNGLLLVGYPNWPLLEQRNDLRRALSIHEHFHEPHAQNIAHSTLIRFTTLPSLANLEKVVAHIQALLPIELTLQSIHVARCSYSMGDEVERLPLYGGMVRGEEGGKR